MREGRGHGTNVGNVMVHDDVGLSRLGPVVGGGKSLARQGPRGAALYKNR